MPAADSLPMAPAPPLYSLEELDSYDGDVETCGSYTATDAIATPLFSPTPLSYSPVLPRSALPPHHMQLTHKLSALEKHGGLSVAQASNRSNSVLTFSPGVHRRSYPSLQHLSLAPLTPKYPITPSDYNAYVDPDTRKLHTSSSLSHIVSMSSPSGILSQSGTRANSRARNRKSKSSVSMQAASGAPRGALTSQGFGGKMTDPADAYRSRHPARRSMDLKKDDSGWLLQAGTTLTEGSRESKGQSWLAKRASSTSLHSPVGEDYPKSELAQVRSGRAMPTRSRRGSRDRRKSRRELAMTPTAMTASSKAEETAAENPPASAATSTSDSPRDYAVIEPDWADPQTQAEIAADLEMELAEELEDGELYSDQEDRYGALDFEGQDIDDEETEIQQAVEAHGFRLGRWVDGVVDALLKADDADEDELEIEHGKLDHEVGKVTGDDSRENDVPEDPSRQDMDDVVSDDGMEPAPQNPKSVWEDLAWFGKLVLRTARS